MYELEKADWAQQAQRALVSSRMKSGCCVQECAGDV